MAQVLVRDLDDSTLKALTGRAKANQRSTQIRAIPDRAAHEPDLERHSLLSLAGSVPADRTVKEIVAEIRALRDEWEDKG